MDKKVKLLPPMMPNFLPMEGPIHTPGEGTLARIPVTELSFEEAVEYGELMKQAFIKHWEKKKKDGKS